MEYVCDIGSGQQLTLRNEGGQTHVGFHSKSPSQQQSQGVGISTGEWKGKPAVLRSKGDLILKLATDSGKLFYHLRGGHVTPLPVPPDVPDAEELILHEVQPEISSEGMPPMAPLRPMEPMRPMEMTMGNMSMKMGNTEAPSSKKFCTQCGSPLDSRDRYCANCGHKV